MKQKIENILSKEFAMFVRILLQIIFIMEVIIKLES